jgi:hypothetical protein
MLMTRLWSGLSWPRAVTGFPQPPQRFKVFHPSSSPWKQEWVSERVRLSFWMFWSSGKGRHWPPTFTGNLPTLADISTSTLTIRSTWKDIRFRVFITQLPQYVKVKMLMKLATLDVITFSSTVIPKVSLTRSLIPRAAVLGINSKSLWAPCFREVQTYRAAMANWRPAAWFTPAPAKSQVWFDRWKFQYLLNIIGAT